MEKSETEMEEADVIEVGARPLQSKEVGASPLTEAGLGRSEVERECHQEGRP